MRLRPTAFQHRATPRLHPSLRISAWPCRQPVRRAVTLFVLLAAVAVAAGCSTPHTAGGTLDEGRRRVTALVLEAAHALPATVTFTPPTKVGTQPCRKTVAGYVIGRTGAHRAQVPLIVKVPAGTGRHLLDVIGSAWSKAGYTLNRSRLGESGFPQLRADTPDGYEVVATALTRSSDLSQIDLYAVSQCLRGS
jgi:hypothetical protein